MKIIVINGPNLNMLGVREPIIYGTRDYAALLSFIAEAAEKYGVDVKVVQHNGEGDMVTEIQNALGAFDAIIINAAAYTHTSVAIYDALKAVAIPTVSVHLTDINVREDFRKVDFISPCAEKSFVGMGFDGYAAAIGYLAEKYGNQ